MIEISYLVFSVYIDGQKVSEEPTRKRRRRNAFDARIGA